MTSCLGFTGTRDFEPGHLRLITPEIADFLAHFDTFVTGGCRGFDAVMGHWLAEEFPDRRHVVILPANREQVDEWWERTASQVDVVAMRPGTDYRARNVEIVRRADALFYCAGRPEKAAPRSGTWMTVRLARGRKTVRVVGITLRP